MRNILNYLIVFVILGAILGALMCLTDDWMEIWIIYSVVTVRVCYSVFLWVMLRFEKIGGISIGELMKQDIKLLRAGEGI